MGGHSAGGGEAESSCISRLSFLLVGDLLKLPADTLDFADAGFRLREALKIWFCNRKFIIIPYPSHWNMLSSITHSGKTSTYAGGELRQSSEFSIIFTQSNLPSIFLTQDVDLLD